MVLLHRKQISSYHMHLYM